MWGIKATSNDFTLANAYRSMSHQEMKKKIRAITPHQRELLGINIIEAFLKNFGLENAARVTLKVRQPDSFNIMLVRQRIEFYSDLFPLPSCIQKCKIAMSLLHPIKKKINESFSNPEKFIKKGINFEVSDDWIVTKAPFKSAGKMANYPITTGCDVPYEYNIKLKLDKKSTELIKELVFVREETSEGTRFSRESFTIRKLEEPFLEEVKDDRE